MQNRIVMQDDESEKKHKNNFHKVQNTLNEKV